MIRILTDSASDIEQKELAGVTVLPLTVTIDGTAYADGIDLTKDEFYRKLESSEANPVSSLIAPHQFQQAFEEITRAGDEAIVLTISSGLSGTYQSAMIAAEDYGNVSVIDTMLVAGAQKILVQRAAELVARGLSRRTIVEMLEAEKSRL